MSEPNIDVLNNVLSGNPALTPSAPDASALSGSRPAPDMPLTAQPPDQRGPQPANPQSNQDPSVPSVASAPKPAGLWQSVLKGALEGLAGSAGAKSFGAGAAGGVGGVLKAKQQDIENDQKQQEIQSNIKFRDAQAASLAIDAKYKDTQLQNLPEQIRQQKEEHSLELMKQLDGMGLSPVLVTPDTGKDAMNGLEQLTSSHGGVPPLFTIHANGQLIGYDLSRLSQTPEGLSIVNQAGAAQSRQPINEQMWRQIPPASRTQLMNDSLKFFDPVPNKENAPIMLQQYKNNLETLKKNPNTDPTLVARVSNVVNNLQKLSDGIDAHEQKMEDQKAAAKNKAENVSPFTDNFGISVTPPPEGAKGAQKVKATFKKDADNLAKTEGTYNQFQDVLNDIGSGKDITGAQSVVSLFNAIGLSAEPLAGKGFRINNNTVEEHAEARGLGENLYQKFLKLKNGDVITPQQIKDYADIAIRSRHDAYVNKVNEARQAGLDPTFLMPRGNGRKMDANTASIFLDASDGNKDNARKVANGLGWKF